MPLDDIKVRRTRTRNKSLRVDHEAIFQRVSDFYDVDKRSRDDDVEARLQRYAKYRMWTDGLDGPWAGSSNIPLPDMTEKSLRLQDTLHNAVMAQRPAITAKALHAANQPKEMAVDQLLDFQFFTESSGEITLGNIAEAFINEGVFTLFIPWVKEERKQQRVAIVDPIPPDMFPPDYFAQVLRQMMGEEVVIEPYREGDDQPWDFMLTEYGEDEDKPFAVRASCYTNDEGRVEIVVSGKVVIFDGPLPMSKQYDDVFHPPRAANLQPPGPSNPGGAPHVILRDYPTKDEIARLQHSKFYDLMTKEDVEAMGGISRSGIGDEERTEQQKDALAKQSADPQHSDKAPSQDTLTRLTCFDRYDIDGDGLDEDVIWWVILETKKVVRARILQEVYPTLRPSHPRPFAEASLFPVEGRRCGFSMLEMLEGIHDALKTIADQTIDANSMGIVPFGFYRATSSFQSEPIALAPGELYPVQDPQRDVAFPQIGNANAMGMAFNLMTLLQQQEERVSVIGDLQLGRVPAGKSSALRTTGSMNLLAGQGEARPERLLRRFMLGLAEAFSVMHDLNQHYLPKNKQIRLFGPLKPGMDPYLEIADASLVGGKFLFTFDANALNTSKAQLQQTLEGMLGTYVNALMIQLGISTPETIYNLLRDYGRARGIDPEQKRYLNPPSPGVLGPKILAEEAMLLILQDQLPEGSPAERGGWAEHLQKLLEFEARLVDPADPTGEISPQQAQNFQAYKAMAAQRAQEEARMQAAAQAAQQFAQAQGAGNQGGRPTEAPPPDPNANPAISGGAEVIDETMPSAGGGGQA